MSNATATIATLNENDNPKAFGGEMLGDDGRNQLWLFGEKVANRYFDAADDAIWSTDVEGWNYDPATDCIEA